MEITHYYLIDLENVGLQGLCGLNLPAAGSEIQIFLSNTAHVGTEEIRKDILSSRAEIGTIYCSIQGKDALDFQLSAYFGAVLERPQTRRISIVSNDSGYQSLVDYAKKRRKQVAVYRAKSIMEAYFAEKNDPNPRMYEKGKNIDFKHIMEERSKKLIIEIPIREKLEDICDEETIQMVISVCGKEETSARERYLLLLKTLGREKGLEVYRMMRDQNE